MRNCPLLNHLIAFWPARFVTMIGRELRIAAGRDRSNRPIAVTERLRNPERFTVLVTDLPLIPYQ